MKILISFFSIFILFHFPYSHPYSLHSNPDIPRIPIIPFIPFPNSPFRPLQIAAKILLGINFDNNLKLNIHVESISQKANRKLNALAKIANYMKLPKRHIHMNAFFKSQFNYYPATWMFHSSAKTNRLHEHC